MTDDIWTVKRILEWIEGYLAQRGDATPRASAQWLVGEALGVSRMQLFLDMDRPLTADERAVLRDWTRRRGTGEPLQYITGTVEFRYITVKVAPGVLIPRPETEVLVSEALALLPAAPKPQDAFDEELLRLYAETSQDGPHIAFGSADPHDAAQSDGQSIEADAARAMDGDLQNAETPGKRVGFGTTNDTLPDAETPSGQTAGNATLLVADICTGTGCIACSIAHEHPLAHVIATDISPAAAALARENVAELELEDRIDVIECDLASGIDNELAGRFDLVVSNPPYVPTSVLADIPEEVSAHEPALALDGGPDGLDVFRRLIAWCATALKPGGAFAFELHETCLDAAAAEARAANFTTIRIVNDLAGRPRVLTGRMSE